MTAADLSKFELSRRYATLFAMAVESMVMVTGPDVFPVFGPSGH